MDSKKTGSSSTMLMRQLQLTTMTATAAHKEMFGVGQQLSNYPDYLRDREISSGDVNTCQASDLT